MKNNLFFAVLTAVILVIGFYSMDIAGYLTGNSPEESFRSIPHDENNILYLSAESDITDPMSIITPSDTEVPEISRTLATDIVKAMSRNSNTTYIAWGVDIPDLYNAWQDGGNNLIYVEKWKYINYGKKNSRLLDCIINTKDFSIVYIRFYSEEIHELSANEINQGLEKLNIMSTEFYPNIIEIMQNIENTLTSLGQNTAVEYDDYPNEMNKYNFSYYDIGRERNEFYITAYNNFRQFLIYCGYDNDLCLFWLSPLDISNVIHEKFEMSLDERTGMMVHNDAIYSDTVHYIIEEFVNLSFLFRTLYSSKDGRIYQTITLDSGNLVVIYSVKEDIIEGFYFESNQQ